MKKVEKHGGFLCLVGMMCLLVACQSVEPGATYTPQWVDQLSTIQLNEEFTSEDQIPDYTNQEACLLYTSANTKKTPAEAGVLL